MTNNHAISSVIERSPRTPSWPLASRTDVPSRSRKPGLLVAFIGGALCLLPLAPAEAGHDVFHIFSPVVEKGHWGFEALSTFQSGLPRHHDEEEAGHAVPRAAHEIALHGGVTDFWMAKLALGLAREDGHDYSATGIALENVFRFTPPANGVLDFAWFTSVGVGLDSGATNTVEFGPVVSLDAGPLSMVLNPFFEKTFGDNREDGIAFAYAARVSVEVAEQVSVGVEAYGEVENLGHAPSLGEQTHRLGPVLYLGHMHGARRHAHGSAKHAADGASHADGDHHGEAGAQHAGDWHAEVGVLFGLTEASPDAALKVNIGTDF